MSTTTIRLTEDLKLRVAEAAQSEGLSTHAFMVEAIARRAREVAERNAFVALADERWQQFVRDGKSVPLAQMRRRVQALVAGRGGSSSGGSAKAAAGAPKQRKATR